jgi:hypothetical protein
MEGQQVTQRDDRVVVVIDKGTHIATFELEAEPSFEDHPPLVLKLTLEADTEPLGGLMGSGYDRLDEYEREAWAAAERIGDEFVGNLTEGQLVRAERKLVLAARYKPAKGKPVPREKLEAIVELYQWFARRERNPVEKMTLHLGIPRSTVSRLLVDARKLGLLKAGGRFYGKDRHGDGR